MSTRTAEFVDAIEQLPDGTMFVAPHATWEEYEELLDALVHRPGVRVTYDEGRLEVMSTSQEHEAYKEFVSSLVRLVADELGLTLEGRGSTTWKRRALRKGTEPDACFYVENAHRIIGRRIDLESDPPPDIVVEIDITSDSLRKFPIYAAFGVPEIWRYDGSTVQMYALTGPTYTVIDRSRFFAVLSSEALAASLELSKNRGQTEALKTLRQQIRDRRF